MKNVQKYSSRKKKYNAWSSKQMISLMTIDIMNCTVSLLDKWQWSMENASIIGDQREGRGK